MCKDWGQAAHKAVDKAGVSYPQVGWLSGYNFADAAPAVGNPATFPAPAHRFSAALCTKIMQILTGVGVSFYTLSTRPTTITTTYIVKKGM